MSKFWKQDFIKRGFNTSFQKYFGFRNKYNYVIMETLWPLLQNSQISKKWFHFVYLLWRHMFSKPQIFKLRGNVGF